MPSVENALTPFFPPTLGALGPEKPPPIDRGALKKSLEGVVHNNMVYFIGCYVGALAALGALIYVIIHAPDHANSKVVVVGAAAAAMTAIGVAAGFWREKYKGDMFIALIEQGVLTDEELRAAVKTLLKVGKKSKSK